MQRTGTKATFVCAIKEDGEIREVHYTVAARNEKEAAKFFKKIYPKAACLEIITEEKLYQLDDETFFSLAKEV